MGRNHVSTLLHRRNRGPQDDLIPTHVCQGSHRPCQHHHDFREVRRIFRCNAFLYLREQQTPLLLITLPHRFKRLFSSRPHRLSTPFLLPPLRLDGSRKRPLLENNCMLPLRRRHHKDRIRLQVRSLYHAGTQATCPFMEAAFP